MPNKPKRICNHPGCNQLTAERFCESHKKQVQEKRDKERGTAHERGYTYRWSKYSKWFLRQPSNQICKLRLDGGCALVSQCVDHINPPDGPDDPLFWDTDNHQASCIHCNSVKGDKYIKGSEWEV